MVLPTVAAVLVDMRLGTLPLVTIAAILICFPLATFFVIRIALQEMDRVIAEVAPPLEWEAEQPGDARAEPGVQDEVGVLAEGESEQSESSQSESSRHAE
jgi:hypothetical protein